MLLQQQYFVWLGAALIRSKWSYFGNSVHLSPARTDLKQVELTWFETHVIDFATLAATMQIVIHLLAEAQVFFSFFLLLLLFPFFL